MGRPSKLTDAQWEAIGKRLLENESAAALAREFGVSKAAISGRFSKRTETIKAVATQIVETERSLSFLNASEQIAAHSLARKLTSISEHLASAAEYGSMTAHKLSHIAHSQSELIDEAAPLESNVVVLKSVAALTAGANEASKIGLNLLAANKGAALQMPPPIEAGSIPDDPNEASRVYQRLIGGG